MLATPAARAVWGLMRDSFPKEFAQYVDAIVSKSPLARSADIGSVLNAVLTELKTRAEA